MIQNVGYIESSQAKSIHFNHPSQGKFNYYIILGPRDKAAPPTNQQVGQFPPKQVKYQHHHPFYFSFLLIHRTALFALNQSEARFTKLGEYIFPKRSFITVPRIPWTMFTKQKFAQLRINYVRQTFFRFNKYPKLGSWKKGTQLRTGLRTIKVIPTWWYRWPACKPTRPIPQATATPSCLATPPCHAAMQGAPQDRRAGPADSPPPPGGAERGLVPAHNINNSGTHSRLFILFFTHGAQQGVWFLDMYII